MKDGGTCYFDSFKIHAIGKDEISCKSYVCHLIDNFFAANILMYKTNCAENLDVLYKSIKSVRPDAKTIIIFENAFFKTDVPFNKIIKMSCFELNTNS